METYSKGDFTCIDLETTGLSVHTAEIIEISAMKVRNFEIIDTFGSLVKPSTPISKMITDITGITNADVENSPKIDDILDDFLNFIDNDILLGHNIARYDLPILRRICLEKNKTIDNLYYDTLIISQKEIPELKSHTFETLCEFYGVINENAHRAEADVKATIEVYNRLVNRINGDISKVLEKDLQAKKAVCKYHKHYSETTIALRSLNEILANITSDNELNEAEVFHLKNWLGNNTQLKGTYPFDVVYSQISDALEDGVLEQHELDKLLNVFSGLLDPIENNSDSSSDICFNGKCVCLSGEFEYGSKADVSEKLSDMGAIVKDSVTKKIDFLIVGCLGNDNWSCGNYGNKVKKALELQEKGHCIKILKETDVFMNQIN